MSEKKSIQIITVKIFIICEGERGKKQNKPKTHNTGEPQVVKAYQEHHLYETCEVSPDIVQKVALKNTFGV